MRDGQRVTLFGTGEVGTHFAFVHLVAKVSWTLRAVPEYRMWVVSVPAGVRLDVEAFEIPADLAVTLSGELRAVGLECPDPDPALV